MDTSMKRLVLVDDGYPHYEVERCTLAAVGAEIALRPCRGQAETVIQAIHDADAVLVRESPITAAAIERAPLLQGIIRYGTGALSKLSIYEYTP
jgi:D-3-phosphoglycerate dehydrogenase / 2-oxoglutarate reductase